MDIISWLIVGALAGWVASMIMGTNAQQGAIANIIVGILGAFVGGFLMSLIGKDGVGGNAFHLRSFLVATLGAVVLLAIYKAVRARA